jgi:hypothetical protein
MEQMELFNFYNLDECVNKKKVLKKLNQLLDEGKIDFSVDREILKIEDLDLSESEVEGVAELLDSNDVFPYLDKEDDDDFYDGYDNYDDEDDY